MKEKYFERMFKKNILNLLIKIIIILFTLTSNNLIRCDNNSTGNEKEPIKIINEMKKINNFFKNLFSLQKEINEQKSKLIEERIKLNNNSSAVFQNFQKIEENNQKQIYSNKENQIVHRNSEENIKKIDISEILQKEIKQYQQTHKK